MYLLPLSHTLKNDKNAEKNDKNANLMSHILYHNKICFLIKEPLGPTTRQSFKAHPALNSMYAS